MGTVSRRIRASVRTVLLAVILLSSVKGETPRPTTLGVSLAYPTTGFVSVPRDFTAQISYELRIPVLLDINAEGIVTNIRERIADDSVILRKVDSALKCVTFVPGLKDGSPVDQKIEADLFLLPGRPRATLRTPVSDSLVVHDAASYSRSLYANGIAIPSIKRLAPYFCTLARTDSLSVLPSILLKLVLSEDGKPMSIDPLRSGYPSITDQIVSVLNWAEYTTANSSGRPSASEMFASVVLHPAALYPTRPIGDARGDTASILEQILVQVYPDTLGLMLPPLPRRLQYDSLTLAEAVNRYAGRLSLGVAVDTVGKTEITRLSNRSRKIYDLCNLVLSRVPLYPALGFDGKPRPFDGLVYIDFEGSANVRICLDWLTRRNEPSVR